MAGVWYITGDVPNRPRFQLSQSARAHCGAALPLLSPLLLREAQESAAVNGRDSKAGAAERHAHGLYRAELPFRALRRHLRPCVRFSAILKFFV